MAGWITENWFELLNAIGIIGGLLFTAHSLRSETETRCIANLLALTKSHRDLLSQQFAHPELARVLDAKADLGRQPITLQETIYANLLIQHLASAYETLKVHLSIKPAGLHKDVQSLFSLPIPQAVWEKAKLLQNDDFVAFVEQCRKGQ